MSFLAVHLLSGIKAFFTGDAAGLDTLAVQTISIRVLVAASLFTSARPQGIVNPLPGVILFPQMEISIHSDPARLVFGQHPPLSSGGDDIEDGINHLTYI